MKQSNRRIAIQIIIFLTYAFFAVNWIAGTTISPQIMEFFKLKKFSSITFISNAITIAKILGNLCAAGIFIKLKPKAAIGFASFLITLGSCAGAFTTQYWLFLVARFIMGFGAALCLVYFSPIAINYFSSEKRTIINGINASAYNTGSIIAMFAVPPAVEYFSKWQHTVLLFGGFSAVLLLLWLLVGEDFQISYQTKAINNNYTIKEGLKDKFCYILPFTYSGLLLLYFVILTIFPLSKNAALSPNTLNIILLLSSVAGAVCSVIIVNKISSRLPVIRYSGAIMFLFALIMTSTKSPSMAIISAMITGFFMLLPITALITIPQELPDMSPTKITVIMGLFWSFSYLIETIVYYLLGLIIDKGGIDAGVRIAVFLSLTFVAGSFLLPETGKKGTEAHN